MNLDQIDLHGKTLTEAFSAIEKNLQWIVEHDKIGIVFIHGKGYHSSGVAVLKQEVRRFLSENEELIENDYLVIKGEDNYRITETFDDGVVVVIKRGYEDETIGGGKKQEEKRQIVFGDEGRELRKQRKKNRSSRSRKLNRNRTQIKPVLVDYQMNELVSPQKPNHEQSHIQKKVAKDEEGNRQKSAKENRGNEHEEGMNNEAIHSTPADVSNNMLDGETDGKQKKLLFEVEIGKAKYVFGLMCEKLIEYSYDKKRTANISQIPSLKNVGGGIIVKIVEIIKNGFIATPIAPSLVKEYAVNNIERLQCSKLLTLLIDNLPDRIFIHRDSFAPYSVGNLRTDMTVAIYRKYEYKFMIVILE